MDCPRCHGLMVSEYFNAPFLDLRDGFIGGRCLNCGAIVDATIHANRTVSAPTTFLVEARSRVAPIEDPLSVWGV